MHDQHEASRQGGRRDEIGHFAPVRHAVVRRHGREGVLVDGLVAAAGEGRVDPLVVAIPHHRAQRVASPRRARQQQGVVGAHDLARGVASNARSARWVCPFIKNQDGQAII